MGFPYQRLDLRHRFPQARLASGATENIHQADDTSIRVSLESKTGQNEWHNALFPDKDYFIVSVCKLMRKKAGIVWRSICRGSTWRKWNWHNVTMTTANCPSLPSGSIYCICIYILHPWYEKTTDPGRNLPKCCIGAKAIHYKPSSFETLPLNYSFIVYSIRYYCILPHHCFSIIRSVIQNALMVSMSHFKLSATFKKGLDGPEGSPVILWIISQIRRRWSRGSELLLTFTLFPATFPWPPTTPLCIPSFTEFILSKSCSLNNSKFVRLDVNKSSQFPTAARVLFLFFLRCGSTLLMLVGPKRTRNTTPSQKQSVHGSLNSFSTTQHNTRVVQLRVWVSPLQKRHPKD